MRTEKSKALKEHLITSTSLNLLAQNGQTEGEMRLRPKSMTIYPYSFTLYFTSGICQPNIEAIDKEKQVVPLIKTKEEEPLTA